MLESDCVAPTSFKRVSLISTLSLVVLLALSSALEAREVPVYKGRVNDYGSRLSPDAELILEHISFQHEELYGNRILLLTIDSLKAESAREFAESTLAQWELAGTEGAPSRVVLVLVSVQEKLVRIETSDGLNESLPSNIRAEILAKSVLPELQKGLYSIGLYRAFIEIHRYLAENGNNRSPVR